MMKAIAPTVYLITITTLLVPTASMSAQGIIIDSFITPGGEPPSSNRGAVSGPGILGGERDVITGGVSPGQSLTIGNGQVVFNSPAGVIPMSLEWDGIQSGSGFPDRARQLPLTDLTAGGALDALVLNVISISGTWDIGPTVTSGSSDLAYASRSVSAPGEIIFPFASFDRFGSPDFTRANGIDVAFWPTSQGSTITFGVVQAISEPSSLALLVLPWGFYLLGAALRSWTRRQTNDA